MITTGQIVDIDLDGFTVYSQLDNTGILVKRKIQTVEIRLDDGRTISAQQRKHIYATMRDISLYTGHHPEEIKALMKYDFISRTGCDYFSLSSVDMTTANEFLNFLIDFCLEHDIPTLDSLLGRSPDTSRYLYACLANKRCCICGKKAQLHHVNHVGMGRNRKEILHLGMEAQALCGGIKGHHDEAHTIGQKSFNEKYHVYGIKLDKHLCEILKLKGRKDDD